MYHLRSSTPDSDRFPLGLRFMALSALFFSLMTVGVKLVGGRLPTSEIVLVRSLVTLVCSYAALRMMGLHPWGIRRGLLIVRGVVGLVSLTCLYYAVALLPLADVTVIQYTSPVFTALLAALSLGEPISGKEALSTLLSLIGVVVIARPEFLFGVGGGLDPVAVGIALIGAVMSSVAYVVVRKLNQSEHALVIVFYFPLVSVIGSFPVALPGFVAPTWIEVIILVFVIGLCAQLGQIYLTRGLRLVPAGRATAISYLQIPLAALWGILFLREYPDAYTLVGASMVIGGVIFTSSIKNRASGVGVDAPETVSQDAGRR